MAQQMATVQATTATVPTPGGGGGGGGRPWDNLERFKNLAVFNGDSKVYEEWSVKFRSLVRAGNVTVGRLMDSVEERCSEEELAKGK